MHLIRPSRCLWLAAALLPALPMQAAINHASFAERAVQLVAADTNRVSRIGAGAVEIAVVASSESDELPKQIFFWMTSKAAPLGLRPRFVRASPRCVDRFFPEDASIGGIIAVDLDRACVAAVAAIAQRRQILTISTRRADIDPIATAIVQERSSEIQVYRSDAALQAEKVVLGADVMRVTLTLPHQSYKLSYQEAVKAEDHQSWEDAVQPLQNAIDLKPDEGEDILVYGMRSEKYLPHYRLGLALYHLGDCEGARSHWMESERQKKIPSSEYQKLKQYQQMRCPPNSGGNSPAAEPYAVAP